MHFFQTELHVELGWDDDFTATKYMYLLLRFSQLYNGLAESKISLKPMGITRTRLFQIILLAGCKFDTFLQAKRKQTTCQFGSDSGTMSISSQFSTK